ncbi:hypothetical protein niasHT_029420 [Heterodera trifolii]|uniref:Uncharacterized protein n=1 Tax=Heterodera trifolii TaxID=157864 RepID=A0ABD2KRP3_9BILA
MGMLILLFLAVFFGFSPFLHSLDKAYVTKPFLLTGGKIGKVSVPYFALDQCKPYHSITHDPKHIDLLPGHIDTQSYKQRVQKDVRFQIETDIPNRKQRTEQFVGISNPKQWRGIKVYTKLTNSSNPLSARELILETSLTNRSYTFEPMTRQLSLNFGTRVSLFTWVTTHFGQPFHDEEFDLAEQYAMQMGYGSFLEQHVGLWLLGMDMLPWMAEEYVSLYVYRGCSCTMDAWFTRPTDENDPIEPIVPSAGSSQCPTKKMDETFELGQLDAQHLQADLVFTVLTDEEWQNFTVELLQQAEEGTNLTMANLTMTNLTMANLTMIMTFTIGTIDDMKVAFPGINTSVVVNGTQMPNGTQQLRFDIFLLKHWYAMMVNGVQFGEVFWPNEWWHGAAWKNITAIRLNGQVLLLYGPELDDYGIENENFNTSVPLPFSQKIDGFRVNSTFFFRVQLLNETHNTVNITFTDGKSNHLIAEMEFNVDAGGLGKEFFCKHKPYFENATTEEYRHGPIQNNSLKILSRRELSLKILMAQDGFYGRSYNEYIKLCPYYWTNWRNWGLLPWSIDHVQVKVPNVMLTVNDITVKQADPKDALEEVYDEEGKQRTKQIEWKRIKYLKINQKMKMDKFFVFVNLLLAKQLNSKSRIVINFFNQGLEFNHFVGRIVNHIALVDGKWLWFGFLDNEKEEWQGIVTYTLGTVIDDNSANQRANGSDHQPLDKRVKLNFTITIDSTSGKIGVEFHLDGQHITKDINGAVLTCCPAEAVPIQDIQYITAYMELSPETAVEMNCIPPEKCILKT